MVKKILITYFSGTGGTKRIAETFEKCFLDNNCEIIKQSLDRFTFESFKEKNRDSFIREIDLIIILFPVYSMEAPKIVFEWIDSLPNGQNTKTVVISVSGGGEVWPNTSCRVNCIKALKKKNYNVVYEKMLIMPPNLFIANYHVTMHLLKVLPLKVNSIVADLLNGKKIKKRINISSYMFSFFHLENHVIRLGKLLKVNSTCTNCGICADHCPRNNIKMEKNMPTFNNTTCAACLRCVYICPNKSIYVKSKLKFILKDGYDIDKIEMKMENVSLEPIEKCCKGFLYSGIKKYLLKDEQ